MKIKLLESEAEYPFRSWFRRLRFSENCIVRVGSRSGTIDRSQCSIPSPREYKCRPNDTIYCCNHNHPQSQAFFVFLSRFPFAELSHSKCFPSSKSNMKKNGLTPGKWERSLKLLVIFRLCNLTHVMTAQLPFLRQANVLPPVRLFHLNKRRPCYLDCTRRAWELAVFLLLLPAATISFSLDHKKSRKKMGTFWFFLLWFRRARDSANDSDLWSLVFLWA